MPLYEYSCEACDEHFELMRRVTDVSTPVCPGCGSDQTRRVVSRSAFVLKGSGWYVTDYGRKSSGGAEPNHAKGKAVSSDSSAEPGDSSSGDERSDKSGNERSDKSDNERSDKSENERSDKSENERSDKSGNERSDKPGNEKSTDKSANSDSKSAAENASKAATP